MSRSTLLLHNTSMTAHPLKDSGRLMPKIWWEAALFCFGRLYHLVLPISSSSLGVWLSNCQLVLIFFKKLLHLATSVCRTFFFVTLDFSVPLWSFCDPCRSYNRLKCAIDQDDAVGWSQTVRLHSASEQPVHGQRPRCISTQCCDWTPGLTARKLDTSCATNDHFMTGRNKKTTTLPHTCTSK